MPSTERPSTEGPSTERPSTPPHRLRADARRNRSAILAAATAAFTADGPNVPMEEIARLAGVGVGTLYRHFPDRETLTLEVARDSVSEMLDHARRAQAEEPTAWGALVRSLGGFRALSLTVRMPGLFSGATAAAIEADETIRRIRAELIEITDTLVRDAQREGALRPDVGGGDVTHLFTLLLQSTNGSPWQPDEIAFERARGIILDGLRARPDAATGGPPLPGRPLSTADLDPRTE
ncbi:DNA-binding transcriptional regulator, AcrR family [Parafrankia irregularis]|uniref:DNA-binding transcriptional regulator, AcrR family n=1 Tax=Parafrankia irregularis TaxID=795642 RepID=A0A0S4QMW4_9ACTN|nr:MULTISPECIES: TetR/AcrR family transcriptional regulator [Parafrankia]MBE3206119.1 TetR/AcrR family transcriptional regulator [Parafrankia sp. CH37]CUU56997.1 DNA-binding transcriptional regulator, AcrR family [Parafrankia irregularis]